uniref:GFA family protein n=1 Tax=Devosia algicola TaxID=3026418 RepID=UPI0038995AFA
MFVCSCLDCQRASGTGHSCLAMVRAGDVATTGTVRTYDLTAESGGTVSRSFCPNCGTPIFGKSSRAPDIVMLPVGVFAQDADWFSPQHQIFARSHHDWDAMGAAIARHHTYPQPRPKT